MITNESQPNRAKIFFVFVVILLRVLLVVLNQLGNYLFNSTNNDIVSDLVDGSIGIAVDRDDDTAESVRRYRRRYTLSDGR